MANEIVADTNTNTDADVSNYSEDNLAQLVEWFEDAEEATREARILAERDRDYVDNKQLTEQELDTLKKRGQPDIIDNEIRRKIDFLTGFEASTARTDPKAFPRNPGDEEASQAVTDMLRFQEYANEFDQISSDVWENMLVEGYGGVEVLGPLASNPKIIEVVRWKWDRLFFDPHSSEHDFSDATFFGGVMWKDLDAAKKKWPEAEDAIESTAAQEPVNSETYDDKPRTIWAQRGKRPRVRIVQMYYRDGDNWHWCLFTKAGKIDGGQVEFIDENGEPDCPLILQSAYIDRENNRYGMVRELVSPQDMINKRQSKSLHMLTVQGGYYEEGAIDDVDEFKEEIAKADGWGRVNTLAGIQPRDKTGDVAGNFQLLQEAKNSIQKKGPNAALAGKQDEAASGRAIRFSQQGGIVEMARLRDRHRNFKRRVYMSIWNRVRQFLDEEAWIRITDDEDNVKFVGFNRPVTFAEQAEKSLTEAGVPEDQIEQGILEEAKAMGIDPQAVVDIVNVPARMDVDIEIENATESINIQEEQFEKLVELAPVIPFPPAVYLKASSFRNKDELIEALQGSEEDMAAQQAQLQIQVKEALAKIADLEAKADKNKAAAVKDAVEANLKAAEAAGTLEAEAISAAMAPPEPNTDISMLGLGGPQEPMQEPMAEPPPPAPVPAPEGAPPPEWSPLASDPTLPQ
jgi:hypothetical protein